VFNTGITDGVEAIIHTDYVDHQGLADQEFRGPWGFKAVVAAAWSGQRDLVVTVEDLIDDGDRAAARLGWTATDHSGRTVEARDDRVDSRPRRDGGRALGWPLVTVLGRSPTWDAVRALEQPASNPILRPSAWAESLSATLLASDRTGSVVQTRLRAGAHADGAYAPRSGKARATAAVRVQTSNRA
jgi:hypothetical protein